MNSATSDISRREFLALSAGSVISRVLLPGDLASHPGISRGKLPNVVMIMTDQQHAGMMSCAGNTWLKTQNLDRLAENGVRFERAYCANPVCSPSRFTMFTGMMPSVIGMEHNGDDGNTVAQTILDNAMGSIFRRAGYRTVYGGKIHLPGQEGVRERVEPYGFEYLTPDDLEGRDRLADVCANFLRQKHDRPFLMVASFINPHDICFMAINAYKKQTGEPIAKARHQECLDEALKMPAGVREDEFFEKLCPPIPPNHGIPKNEPDAVTSLDFRPFRAYVRQNWTDRDWRMHRWAYARLTERVDAEIGRILDALKQSGLAENTLVVFTSDHGDMDAAHRLEHKSMPYEEAMHVPFIISWKGVIRAGAVDREHLVSTGLDLLPTICDFVGVRIPSALQGKSVRKLAAGEPSAGWRKSLVIENEKSRFLHMGDRKYAVYASAGMREQFMDLNKDPGEMTNVAYEPEYRSQVEEGRKLLKEWYASHGWKLDAKYLVEGCP